MSACPNRDRAKTQADERRYHALTGSALCKPHSESPSTRGATADLIGRVMRT